MRKVIKNKVYDTSTARYVGSSSNTTLYQKRTGEFFLYYEVGSIEPMSYGGAKAWTKSFLSSEKYERYFGKPQEDDARIVISISIRKDTHAKLKQEAAKAGKTVSEYIDSLV
mgnify:CR=1 FL=1